ncbi:hypothetical protein DFH09DRAFT_1303726 [Mycena vulgaris]|nr:hypothetical protein DFH09DRAFT_1303726 [Mycena vulgaris]
MSLIGGILTDLIGGTDTQPTPSKGGILPTLLPLPTIPLSIPILSLPTIPIPGLPTTTSASQCSILFRVFAPVFFLCSLNFCSFSFRTKCDFLTDFLTSRASYDLRNTGADGVGHTVTHVVTVPSAASSQSAAPVANKSFLQNKALSGAVFGVAGAIGLVLIIILATLAVRRSKRRRLLDDAVSFDPGLLAAADRYDGSEKGHGSHASLGTTGSGRPAPAPAPTAGYGNYRTEPAQYYGGSQNAQSEYYGGSQNAQSEYYGASRSAQQPDYYGAPQHAQQPYYSAYVPPMADDHPPSSLAAATPSRAQPHAISRVPVPQQPLPAEFGSSADHGDRRSIEEAEFWARTLKVANE